jgi:hypothetical protein
MSAFISKKLRQLAALAAKKEPHGRIRRRPGSRGSVKIFGPRP